MSTFAEIVFPIPVDTKFSYLIPEKFKEITKPGVRAIVPFKTGKRIGYVVSIASECPVKSPKELISIMDPEISIPQNLLDLSRWMAGYYFCSLGETIDSFFPPRVDSKSIEYFSVTDKGILALKKAGLDEEIKNILKLVIDTPMQKSSINNLSKKMGIGQVVASLEGKGYLSSSVNLISKDVRKKDVQQNEELVGKSEFTLTLPQQKVIQALSEQIENGVYKTFLLHGVTGSGKTEIYIKATEKALEKNQEVIILVPEIALTYQMVSRFLSAFGKKVAILHSSLTPVEKFNEWKRIRNKEVSIAIGARSAIFAPFEKPGLIIVDEEHDFAYKQEETPRYNARDVAVIRGSRENAVVLLGSATPSLESLYNASMKKYSLLELPDRIDKRPMPKEEVVDLKGRYNEGIITEPLKEKIFDRLQKKEQVLLFLNRRGSSTFVQCVECGFVWRCKNCDITLTYHKDKNSVICHYCGYEEKISLFCPDCKGLNIKFLGTGTQKAEEEIKILFPEAIVARLDRDATSSKGVLEKTLQNLRKGKIDILIGTQMISKGHDFPNITLVGILSADNMLNLPDFRAGEKTFQQIMQVAGRGGRGEKRGEVIAQTYNPGNFAIQCSLSNKFDDFYQNELALRKALSYPPFSKLVSIRIEGLSEAKVENETDDLNRLFDLTIKKVSGVEKLGPVKAVLYKIKNRFRMQILIKGEEGGRVRQVVRHVLKQKEENKKKNTGVRVIVDVDPVNMV